MNFDNEEKEDKEDKEEDEKDSNKEFMDQLNLSYSNFNKLELKGEIIIYWSRI